MRTFEVEEEVFTEANQVWYHWWKWEGWVPHGK